MKAYLMYRDRDFDPHQLLTRREKELRYRDADAEALSLKHLLPWNHEALTQDLGLDILVQAMAGEDKFLFEACKVAVLASLTDLDTIRYRQRVFSDCLKNEQIIREIYQLAIEAIAGERKSYWGFARYPSGILHRAVEVLQMFVGVLRKLRSIADYSAKKFDSDGFTRMFAMLRDELSDEFQ